MNESLQIIIRYMPALLRSLPTTMQMLVYSVVLAALLGLFVAWARLSKNKLARGLSGLFISFMRGTPMMVQILLIFILVPVLANRYGIRTNSWDPMIYAIVSYTLNMMAFFAEIYRSAYLGLDHRQIEAAESLGMNKLQVFRRVILPQAGVTALPNMTNMSLELMKNTSIASVIGVYDILGRAQQLSKNSYGVGTMELYLTVGTMFWLIGLVILLISNAVVKSLSKGDLGSAKKKSSLLAGAR